MKKRLRILIFLVAVALAHSVVMAQQPTASLTGVVTDPNGAVIAGAKVTAVNTATNVTRNTVSNDDGLYVLSNLLVGKYKVKVEAHGFETKTSADDVTLTVGQSVRLDATLLVGQITETTDLTAEMPMVDIDT